jgi:hypothetical protein
MMDNPGDALYGEEWYGIACAPAPSPAPSRPPPSLRVLIVRARAGRRRCRTDEEGELREAARAQRGSARAAAACEWQAGWGEGGSVGESGFYAPSALAKAWFAA